MKQINKKLTIIIISGIILRIVLMISSCHFDLLTNYWNAHFLAYHREIPENLFNGTLGFWPIIYIQGLWLFFIRPFMNKGIDLWPEQWFLQGNYHIVNLETWQQFVSQPNIHSILFLLKLPYLIFELILIIIIVKMLSSDNSKIRITKFLFFNPLSLFITYIFGAYDIIIVFFVVLSLYLIKQRRFYLGILSLGLSIFVKFYTLFLLPLFIIMISKDWLKRLKLAICALMPLIILAVSVSLKGKFGTLMKFIIGIPHVDYIFSLILPFQHLQDRIYPFIVGYCLIIFYIMYTYTHSKNNLFYDLNKYALVLSLLFYSFCFFHSQYFLLIVPLMAIQIDRDKWLLPLFFIQIICFFIYTFQWERDLSWRLFMPINPYFFSNLKSPSEFIWQICSTDKFIGIFRSIFVSISLWIIYRLMREKELRL